MTTMTAEMDAIERKRLRYQYLARQQQLKLEKLKLEQNIAKLDDEEIKIQKHLDELPGD